MMGIYTIDEKEDILYLEEQVMYGSSRLGNIILHEELNLSPADPVIYTQERGKKRYELNNHLGNVLTTISDRRILNCTTQVYFADIINVSDYSPFGAPLAERTWTKAGAESYRFGFNGQMKDDEVYGEGNAYDFGSRMYDPRIGRWSATDPRSAKYPNVSPYAAFANNPILIIDPGGDTLRVYNFGSSTPFLTLNTDLVNQNIYLPKDYKFEGTSMTFNLTDFVKSEMPDAFMISFDAAGAFGGGGTVGFSVVIINRGVDKGGVFRYRQGGVMVGLTVGAGAVFGEIDFNENNSANTPLNRYTFEGKAQGTTFGLGALTGASIQSYTDGKYHTDPTSIFQDNSDDLLYEGAFMGPGTGAEVGGGYFWSSAVMLNEGFQFPPETKGEPYPPAKTGQGASGSTNTAGSSEQKKED